MSECDWDRDWILQCLQWSTAAIAAEAAAAAPTVQVRWSEAKAKTTVVHSCLQHDITHLVVVVVVAAKLGLAFLFCSMFSMMVARCGDGI